MPVFRTFVIIIVPFVRDVADTHRKDRSGHYIQSSKRPSKLSMPHGAYKYWLGRLEKATLVADCLLLFGKLFVQGSFGADLFHRSKEGRAAVADKTKQSCLYGTYV